MAASLSDIITYFTLGISIVSLILVILAFERLSRVSKESAPSIQTTTAKTEEDNLVEVSAIVSEFGQRLRRFEESLIDQKVKLEIVDLRMGRASAVPAREAITIPNLGGYEKRRQPFAEEIVERRSAPLLELHSESSNSMPAPESAERKKLASSELEALRLVFEGHGKATAKEIQQQIGRTREHTARMMNSLYHEGLVERDSTARPFAYSITEKGRGLLSA